MTRPANFNERLTAQAYQPRASQPENAPHPDMPYPRQSFHRPQTSIGAGSAGHWIKMAGILSPLIIGEIVKDADKRWRWIRIASVATALVSEGFYAHRVSKRRQEQQQECCR
jgi:hypothetical protein